MGLQLLRMLHFMKLQVSARLLSFMFANHTNGKVNRLILWLWVFTATRLGILTEILQQVMLCISTLS